MFRRIAIINKSTVVTNNDVAKMANACNLQVAQHVSPAWGKSAIPVTFYQNERVVPMDSAKLYIFDDSDQPDALGWHSESDAGVVFGKVFAKTILQYNLPVLFDARRRNETTVSSVVSHEVLELFCNPYVALWSDGPAITEGSEYAYETCDPVEANVYPIKIATNSFVSVSNFVYPEYFDMNALPGTRFDYLNLLTAPFTMTDYGYMIVRSAPGSETAIYGQKYPEVLKKLNESK